MAGRRRPVEEAGRAAGLWWCLAVVVGGEGGSGVWRSVYDPLRDNQAWKWHKKWDQREERREIRSGENPKVSEEADASQLVWLRP